MRTIRAIPALPCCLGLSTVLAILWLGYAMSAITVLTLSTMWMGHGQGNILGARVNAATKMLLCIVSIEFVTARSRPAAPSGGHSVPDL